ncbi:MAG: MCE family protein [Alphaproteobacteria bacterium]|nr:MCE family protein [Alphaproteobacteria bacterium]
MRSNRINYFVVGLFVIVSVVGLVVAVAVLSGRTGAADNYHAVYRNVTGVKFGTQVMYEGYPIGQVETVVPVADAGGMSFRVNFGVRQGWKIPDDSVANIAAPGLLSAITISIAAGKSTTPLKPGAQIKSQEAANIFSAISSVAGDIGSLTEQDIRPLLGNLNRIAALVRDMMEKEDLMGKTAAAVDNIQAFTESMKRNSEEISTVFSAENIKKMDRTIANLDAMIAENKDDVRFAVESVSRHIESINQNLDGMARNMFEFSRQVRQNPGLLMGGTPPRDTAPKQ